MKKLKQFLVFLLKAIIVQSIREYLLEMNDQGKDPLELKPILKRLICDAQKEM